VPAPAGDMDAPFLMQVSQLGWNDHIGRTGTGRVISGKLKKNQEIRRLVTAWDHPKENHDGPRGKHDTFSVVESFNARAQYMWSIRGLDPIVVEEIAAGDVVTIAGPADLNIGDTITIAGSEAAALPPLEIE